MDAAPQPIAAGIKSGKGRSRRPANTLALLKANAVAGLTGLFEADGKTLKSIGIQCSLPFDVDDAFMPGIGRRLDGWLNRDLSVGAIAVSAPNLAPLHEKARDERHHRQKGSANSMRN